MAVGLCWANFESSRSSRSEKACLVQMRFCALGYELRRRRCVVKGWWECDAGDCGFSGGLQWCRDRR